MGRIQPTPLSGRCGKSRCFPIRPFLFQHKSSSHPVTSDAFRMKTQPLPSASPALPSWIFQACPSLLTLLVFRSTCLLFCFSRLFSAPNCSPLPSASITPSYPSTPSENITVAKPSLTSPDPVSSPRHRPFAFTAFTPYQSYSWSVVISSMSLQETEAPHRLASVLLTSFPQIKLGRRRS